MWFIWRGRVKYGICGEVGQTAVQSRGGDVGVRQSIHRSEVLCRDVAAERTEGGAWAAAARARGAVTIGVDLAVQLIECVLAI